MNMIQSKYNLKNDNIQAGLTKLKFSKCMDYNNNNGFIQSNSIK